MTPKHYANMTQEEKQALLSQVPSNARRPRQCEHIKANGEFCGSPALRGRNHCYFHLTHLGRRIRAERAHARLRMQANDTGAVPLELPPFEDANSIQVALMQVVEAILQNRIDSKRAGLVLYALQTASSNLANGADFEEARGATVAGRYDNFEEDFELADTAPELKKDESAVEEEEAEEHAAKLVQIQEMAEAYAKLDVAEEEALERARRERAEGDTRDDKFRCPTADLFFCSIIGPMSKPQRAAEAAARRQERNVQRQRLACLSELSSPGEEAA